MFLHPVVQICLGGGWCYIAGLLFCNYYYPNIKPFPNNWRAESSPKICAEKSLKFGFANQQDLGKVTFVEEVASGRTSWRDRRIAGILEELQESDTIIVAELYRLGRSMLECMAILSLASGKGIRIYVLLEPLIAIPIQRSSKTSGIKSGRPSLYSLSIQPRRDK